MDEQETNRFSVLPGDPKQASSGVAMSLEFQSLEHPFFPYAQFLSIGRAWEGLNNEKINRKPTLTGQTPDTHLSLPVQESEPMYNLPWGTATANKGTVPPAATKQCQDHRPEWAPPQACFTQPSSIWLSVLATLLFLGEPDMDGKRFRLWIQANLCVTSHSVT